MFWSFQIELTGWHWKCWRIPKPFEFSSQNCSRIPMRIPNSNRILEQFLKLEYSEISTFFLIFISDTTYLFVKKEDDCENIFDLKADKTSYFKKCVEVVDNQVKVTKIQRVLSFVIFVVWSMNNKEQFRSPFLSI